jgi:hypothetical protein
MQSSYDVAPTGTPSYIVKKAEKLRNVSTEEELSAQDVGDAIKGRVAVRIPLEGVDSVAPEPGDAILYSKTNGNDKEIWARFNVGGTVYSVFVATSATPTPTATPTPEPTATPTP